MRVIQKSFTSKITDLSNNILKEQTQTYYEVENDTLEIISGSDAIKLQIKHWFDTGVRERYFQISYGQNLSRYIHRRVNEIADLFDLNDFIDKLETDLQNIIIVNRTKSKSYIGEVDGSPVLFIELSYIVNQSNIIDEITLEIPE